MKSNKTNKHNNIIWPQNLNTYLGNKGYTLLKSELTISQQLALKEMLMVTPRMPGAPVQLQKTYPVYRESDKKMYIPRYFGEKIFGLPKIIKITEGDDVNLSFGGTLRDYQVPVFNKYLDHIRCKDGGSGLLELYCAFGKTDTAVALIGELKKKTLIIVHKEFLLNQWIERINKYMPSARIGKIQGQIIDINDKDIVLCMLQSLSMKDYPSTLFDSFGFTIIDEVHHISSEVFSCALFKLVTKYMLGLSATMDRKDGTTEVFKMFLGEVVCKVERPKTEQLTVRGITYEANDDEFNELELDFRGKPASAKMISKLCNYNRRSEFILKVLKDMLEENPNQQIMMLSSYKSILAYMFDAINHQNICSVGYYVGGMKESALKESENKKVVLATYAMASEGLDIKTLSTLFMITPMTNIEQSVGRILRSKHGFEPIVVDFIDVHDNFQRQWTKRKTFYRKQNYKIIQIGSFKYTKDVNKWKTTFIPKLNNAFISYKEDRNDDYSSDNNEESEPEQVVSKCLLQFKK